MQTADGFLLILGGLAFFFLFILKPYGIKIYHSHTHIHTYTHIQKCVKLVFRTHGQI